MGITLLDRPPQGDTSAILADWLSSTSVGILKTASEVFQRSPRIDGNSRVDTNIYQSQSVISTDGLLKTS